MRVTLSCQVEDLGKSTPSDRLLLVVVTAALVLSGCGRYYYGKPVGTYSDFRDDSLVCARDVGIPSGNGQYAAISPTSRRCMLTKGWEREKTRRIASG